MSSGTRLLRLKSWLLSFCSLSKLLDSCFCFLIFTMVIAIGSTSQGCYNKSVALEQCLIHSKHLVTTQYCFNSYYEIDFQGCFHPSPTFQLASMRSFCVHLLVASNSFSNSSSRDANGNYIFWSLTYSKTFDAFYLKESLAMENKKSYYWALIKITGDPSSLND